MLSGVDEDGGDPVWMALHLAHERGDLGEIGTCDNDVEDFQLDEWIAFEVAIINVTTLNSLPAGQLGRTISSGKPIRTACNSRPEKGVRRSSRLLIEEDAHAGRPTEMYSKPSDFIWAGERKLRPSRTKGRAI